jgi:hypothetical protein
MDNGQWTMDRDYVPFRANPNIADPTDPTDPTDLLDPSDLLSVFRPCKVRVPSV